MLVLVLNQKKSACLLSSDFRSENPRIQTLNYYLQHYILIVQIPIEVYQTHRIYNQVYILFFFYLKIYRIINGTKVLHINKLLTFV